MFKIKKGLIYFLIISVLVLLAATFIYFYFRNTHSNISKNIGIIVPDQKPKYHFVLISENLGDPFWASMQKGIQRASKEFDVAVEVNGPSFPNPDEESKYFNIAVASRVDAIATHVWNEDESQKLIDYAVGKKIPVVTIDTDAKNSKRSAFIGANAYDSGIQLGRMLISASNGKASAAILINSKNENATVQNIIISGIKDAVADYNKIKISIIDITNSNYTGVEDAAGELLTTRTDLDSILCITSKDTESVAQRLIDLNKVGCNIIGSGDSISILNYIAKGVIYGTIAKNSEQMGYDTVKAMVDLKTNGRTSAYYPTDIRTITKTNISKYLSVEAK